MASGACRLTSGGHRDVLRVRKGWQNNFSRACLHEHPTSHSTQGHEAESLRDPKTSVSRQGRVYEAGDPRGTPTLPSKH